MKTHKEKSSLEKVIEELNLNNEKKLEDCNEIWDHGMTKQQIVDTIVEELEGCLESASRIGIPNPESSWFPNVVLYEEDWIRKVKGLSERLVKYVDMYKTAIVDSDDLDF